VVVAVVRVVVVEVVVEVFVVVVVVVIVVVVVVVVVEGIAEHWAYVNKFENVARGFTPLLTIVMAVCDVTGMLNETAPEKANGGFGLPDRIRVVRELYPFPVPSSVAMTSETPMPLRERAVLLLTENWPAAVASARSTATEYAAVDCCKSTPPLK